MTEEEIKSTHMACYIIDNFPSIGVFNNEKRFRAYQWMSRVLDMYREGGGDYLLVFRVVVKRFRPARKSLEAAFLYYRGGVLFPAHLHKAGQVFLFESLNKNISNDPYI